MDLSVVSFMMSFASLLLQLPSSLISLDTWCANHSVFKVHETREEALNHGLNQLDNLVGVDDFKQMVKDFVSAKQQEPFDDEAGIHARVDNYNMVITGNPGSGKTTVARLLSEIYYGAGIIEAPKLVEVCRQDIVAQVIGGTEKNFKDILKKAEGGILFIDEAYTLFTTGFNSGVDFGKIVLDMLTKAVDDNKCIIILAGYEKPMENLLGYNAGLSRRFPYKLKMPDFSASQCYEIFDKLCTNSNFIVDNSVKDILMSHFEKAKTISNFGNGGYVKSLFEATILARNRFLTSLEPEKLSKIDRHVITENYVKEAIAQCKLDDNKVSPEGKCSEDVI